MPTEASPLVADDRGLGRSSDSAPHTDAPRLSRAGLMRKVGPALLGNMIEFYEFGVYALVTEALHDNFFGEDDQYGVWIGFGISFVARPFGGFFFGYLADRISRRFALVVSIGGMIVSTVCIGLLPTQLCCGPVWGMLGVILLIACKFLQGLCVGGELTTVIVFCAEHAGRLHAGFGISLAVFTAGLGTVLSELVVMLISSLLTEDQMTDWGWRIPFLIVLPWGMFAVYLRRGLHEPDHGGEAALSSSEIVNDDTPIKRLWRTHRWHLVVGTCLFAGQHVGFWGNIIFAKSFLIQADVRTVMWALAATLVGLCFSLTFKIVGGVACDRLAVHACERYPSLRTTLFGGVRWGAMRIAPVVAGILVAIVFPLWVLMVLPDQSWASLLAEAIFGIFDGILGIVLILIALELFPVSVRATGIGLAYNIAHALFSSVTPLVAGAIWKNWKHAQEKADADTLLGQNPWLANTAPAMWPLICYVITALALVPLLRGWVKTESAYLIEADLAGKRPPGSGKNHR